MSESELIRYWDKTRNKSVVKILPGQYYACVADELISTVLGSCISACIRDVKILVGGMNHFMLPTLCDSKRENYNIDDAARYGNVAMEYLLNNIYQLGGAKKRLEIKLFGGGKMYALSKINVSERNISFIRKFMAMENMNARVEDLGGIQPRKIIYNIATGEVMVKKLNKIKNDTICQREKKYLYEIDHKPLAGNIELFE